MRSAGAKMSGKKHKIHQCTAEISLKHLRAPDGYPVSPCM